MQIPNHTIVKTDAIGGSNDIRTPVIAAYDKPSNMYLVAVDT